MNRQQFEEQLKKLSADYQQITNDKNQSWLSISSKISDIEQESLTVREISLETPMRTSFMRYAPAALILLIIFGSGVTAVSASQNTLPGDLLYPLQRAIETVRDRTIIKSQNKIEFKIRKAEKRLHEINEMKLMHANKESIAPTAENTVDYQNAVLEAVENYNDAIEKIEKKNDIKSKKHEWEKRLKALKNASDKIDTNNDQNDVLKNDSSKEKNSRDNRDSNDDD